MITLGLILVLALFICVRIITTRSGLLIRVYALLVPAFIILTVGIIEGFITTSIIPLALSVLVITVCALLRKRVFIFRARDTIFPALERACHALLIEHNLSNDSLVLQLKDHSEVLKIRQGKLMTIVTLPRLIMGHDKYRLFIITWAKSYDTLMPRIHLNRRNAQ